MYLLFRREPGASGPSGSGPLGEIAAHVYRKFAAWLKKKGFIGEFGGFSIHAGVTVHAADRDGRERLIRYCARPALSMERMSETKDGLIAYRLRHAQKGKATHRVMRPIDFLARIAAIIPPPRHPLQRYFGVFGPHSSWRKLCVPQVEAATQTKSPTSTSQSPDSVPTASDSDGTKVSPDPLRAAPESGAAVVDGATLSSGPKGHNASPKLAASLALNPWRIDWATLLKRTYDYDVLKCECGGRLKAVELVTEAGRAKELLDQFGMSTKQPPVAPSLRATHRADLPPVTQCSFAISLRYQERGRLG